MFFHGSKVRNIINIHIGNKSIAIYMEEGGDRDGGGRRPGGRREETGMEEARVEKLQK